MSDVFSHALGDLSPWRRQRPSSEKLPGGFPGAGARDRLVAAGIGATRVGFYKVKAFFFPETRGSQETHDPIHLVASARLPARALVLLEGLGLLGRGRGRR